MTRSAITGSTARNLAQDSRHNASDRGPIRIGVTTEQVRDEWIEFDAQASDPGYGVTVSVIVLDFTDTGPFVFTQISSSVIMPDRRLE
jgi:hypothetical protein